LAPTTGATAAASTDDDVVGDLEKHDDNDKAVLAAAVPSAKKAAKGASTQAAMEEPAAMKEPAANIPQSKLQECNYCEPKDSAGLDLKSVCLQSPKLFGKKGEEDDSGSWECLYTSTAVAHATKEQCAMGVVSCEGFADAEIQVDNEKAKSETQAAGATTTAAPTTGATAPAASSDDDVVGDLEKHDDNDKAVLAAAASDSVWSDLTMDQKIAMCTAQHGAVDANP
jgi:hypothetical protein